MKNEQIIEEKEDSRIGYIIVAIVLLVAIGILVTWYFTKDNKEPQVIVEPEDIKQAVDPKSSSEVPLISTKKKQKLSQIKVIDEPSSSEIVIVIDEPSSIVDEPSSIESLPEVWNTPDDMNNLQIMVNQEQVITLPTVLEPDKVTVTIKFSNLSFEDAQDNGQEVPFSNLVFTPEYAGYYFINYNYKNVNQGCYLEVLPIVTGYETESEEIPYTYPNYNVEIRTDNDLSVLVTNSSLNNYNLSLTGSIYKDDGSIASTLGYPAEIEYFGVLKILIPNDILLADYNLIAFNGNPINITEDIELIDEKNYFILVFGMDKLKAFSNGNSFTLDFGTNYETMTFTLDPTNLNLVDPGIEEHSEPTYTNPGSVFTLNTPNVSISETFEISTLTYKGTLSGNKENLDPTNDLGFNDTTNEYVILEITPEIDFVSYDKVTYTNYLGNVTPLVEGDFVNNKLVMIFGLDTSIVNKTKTFTIKWSEEGPIYNYSIDYSAL